MGLTLKAGKIRLRQKFSRLVQIALSRMPGWMQVKYMMWEAHRWGDPELKLLPKLVDPSRLALDVGAAYGNYSYHLIKLARRCVAFEPNPTIHQLYTKNFPKAEAHRCALSDKAGNATLRVPMVGEIVYPGFSSIDPTNDLSSLPPCVIQEIPVDIRTGDSFNFDPIGFIKIDVEGHEVATVKGFIKTISRDKPNMLIEVRDDTLPEIERILCPLGYHSTVSSRTGNTRNVIFQAL